MIDLRVIFGFIAVFFLLVSCSIETTDEIPIAKVGNSVLYRYELEQNIPQGLSPNDSTIAVEHFIRRWITDALVYDIARKNVRDIDQINMMVERYRRSLLIFRYQEQLLNERFKGNAADSAFFEKRNEFMRKTENEIYERALNRGEIQLYKD
ncbi:MAG: hypothetical protein LBS54_02385 [Dysgonamonadaceae bacterium]|nr:hypothetical protein [Dysgonamonadaceae bacterium]